MTILITGSTGLLGQALVKRLLRPYQVVGVSRHPPPGAGTAWHRVCDLTDPTATQQMIRRVKPDVVIHTQALSDVDRCELEHEHAEQMNVQTVDHLCHACQHRAPLLIVLSTDYVFDGSKGSPYVESDEPRPLSVYGNSKLAGERIALRYPRAVIVRSSTLFGPGRMNFCDAVVERCRQGQSIEAFIDQTTSPTYTEDLAAALERLMVVMTTRPLKGLPRIYHITNAGGCSRVQFAQHVAGLLGRSASLIRPIQMRDQHRPATRPAHSALTSEHVFRLLGKPRPWHVAVNAYLANYMRPEKKVTKR